MSVPPFKQEGFQALGLQQQATRLPWISRKGGHGKSRNMYACAIHAGKQARASMRECIQKAPATLGTLLLRPLQTCEGAEFNSCRLPLCVPHQHRGAHTDMQLQTNRRVNTSAQTRRNLDPDAQSCIGIYQASKNSFLTNIGFSKKNKDL